ncbi:MAG: hypothetical protein AAFQ17_05910, partial [Pseudomonadota bacterium]
LEDADAAITASGNVEWQIAWTSGSTVERASPMVAAMAGALGLDAAALDALFTAASEISV